MPPLLLDEDEAIAVAVGLRTAARAHRGVGDRVYVEQSIAGAFRAAPRRRLRADQPGLLIGIRGS
jgi:hypothetical protein